MAATFTTTNANANTNTNSNESKSVKASLTCIQQLTEYKSNEQAQIEWQSCLSNIDSSLGKIYDDIITNETELIVISIPYKLTDIHQTIERSISDQLPSNCFEVIMDFMFPSKKFIQERLSKSMSKSLSSSSFSNANSNNRHNNNNTEIDTWNIDKHDNLLKTEAIIIINMMTSKFSTVPRDILALIPDFNSNTNKARNWKLSWNRTPSQDKHKFTQIFSIIGHHIGCLSFPEYFHLSHDWSLKMDFTDTMQVGYLCDSGEIAFGDVCKQNSYTSKIFITYNTNSAQRGKKYEWITIPNYRLCGPSLDEMFKKNKHLDKDGKTITRSRSNPAYRDLSTFYCSAPGQSRPRRSRSRYEEQLQQAIAASLGNENVTPVERSRSRRNHNDNDGEDVQRAIAASLGQTYVAGDQRESNNNNIDNNDQNGDWNMGSSSTGYDDELQRALAASLKEMEVDSGTNNDDTNQVQNENENENEMVDNNNDNDVATDNMVVEERRNNDNTNNGNSNYIDWGDDERYADDLQRAIAESMRQQ